MASGAAPRTRRPPLLRVVRVAVAVVASLAALYVVAVNVFLSTSLFTRVVDAHPDSIDIRFQRAWSLLPGYVHARNVAIRGRDSHIEWRITLDEAKLHVSLLALLQRRFEASHIRATGGSFRFRQRLDAAPSSPEAVTGLPPIAGFPPYSVRPPATKPTKQPDAGQDSTDELWTVRLESVVANDVREVWVDHARFEGSARIGGRFYLKPREAIEVGPAHVAVTQGHVSTATGPVAEALDGSVLDVTVARFNPNMSSADILRGLSLACDTRVTLPDLARLPLPLPAGMTVRGAVEVRRAVLRVSSGVLVPDSQLSAIVPRAVVSSGSHRIRGDLGLEAGVAPSPTDRRGQLTFRAEVRRADVSHQLKPESRMQPVLHAPKVVATGDSSALELADFLEDLHVLVEAPDGDVANARELSRYIPPTAPVALVDGHARAELRFEVWAGQKRATGRAVLRTRSLHFRLAQLHVRGSVSIRAQFASYHFGTRRLEDATLVVEATDGTLSSAAAPDKPVVRMKAAELRAHAPVVDLADPLRTVDVSVSLPSAHVVAAGLLRAYLPKGSEMQIATSDSRFSLNMKLTIAEHLARGVLEMESQALAIHHRDRLLTAHVGARARVHDWHWERGDLALDGARIDVDNLAISKPDAAGRHAVALSIAHIGIGAKSTHFKFQEPLAKVTLAVSLVDARVHDLSAANAFLPENATFGLEGENATFGAALDADIEDHSATGTVRVSASNIGVGKGRAHLRGDVQLFANFADWKQHEMKLLDSRVEMTRVAGRLGAAKGPPQISAKRVALSTSAPKLDLANPTLKGSDFHFVFEEGKLPDARALAAILAPDSVIQFDSGAAHVAADVTVSNSRRAANGIVDVAFERGRVRLDKIHLSGDFRFVTRLSGFDPERRVLDLSGTRLEMRNIAVTGATATTSHWRGDIGFSQASLRLAPPALFDGVVRIDARDMRPLLALMFRDHLPGFVVGLMDMPRLTGSLRLMAGAKRLAFVDLAAGGGDFRLRGSYAVRNGRHRGGFIARKAFLSVGLKLDDDGTHLRLFGLEDWLHDQNCAVSEQLQVPRASCPPLEPQALTSTARAR